MFRALFVGRLRVIALLTKTTPESAHEYSRLGTVESLVQRQTFQLDDSTFIDTLDKIFRGGHYYSHQPPLLALIEAPVYWGLHLPGARFGVSGTPAAPPPHQSENSLASSTHSPCGASRS